MMNVRSEDIEEGIPFVRVLAELVRRLEERFFKTFSFAVIVLRHTTVS